jgi:predicted O-methyltransferase YrrM
MTERAAAVLAEIEALADREFLPIIGPAKGQYLVDTLKKVKANTVLEVGTLVGYSAILMAQSLPAGGMVHTIEIDPSLAHLARRNIDASGLGHKITLYLGNALAVIPTLNIVFDMLFVDAAKNEYLAYLKLAEEKLRVGGAVFADNAGIFADSMADYLAYIRTSGKYQSAYHAVGSDGVEISLKL